MLYVIVIAAVVIFWLIFADRPTLKIDVKQGEIAALKGHCPTSFKRNVVEIGHQTPFDGTIKVYHRKRGAQLVFSKPVPKSVQQRIRNVFPHQGFRNDKGKKRS
ncbi:DUF3634 family protein [Vibrio sp. SM6]|uniref:DUF3634 family protein n=1 Tax=Vibrio agarilyticus TaxID=2726741 RepID=A0A7X8YGD2_9VIBR|nr:DUF3634 family protein [Vibrio agarilyticus]NLS12564.1 DUF3634 family protein [Vibrio agarilyticus]